MGASLTAVRECMTRYIMSIFLPLGIVGNLINIYMFTRKESLRNSCSLYLLAASIVNILSVTWGISPSLYTLDNTDPSTYSYIYCKLRLYTIHTILMIGRSLIVFACIDRYALCSQSRWLRSFCEPKVAMRVIIGHIFIWPLITMYIPLIQDFVGNRCYMSGSKDLIYALYSTIIAGIVPPLLMSTFSVLTIRHRRELRTRLNVTGAATRRDNAFMVMLFCQVIVYVVTTSLYPSITLYLAVTDGQDKSTQRRQIESFLSFVGGSFLIYLNPASSFYIYFLASKNYRKDCKLAFLKLRKRLRGHRGQVNPNPTPPHTVHHVHHQKPV